MREKMKKMLFLMLFLIILGAANVTSQVRIGGNGVPNGAAVLDLNATDAINNGTKTLALPRVSLASTTDQLGSTLLNGMLVYNTNASSGAGVYYWDTNKWVKVSDGAFTEADGVIGNEITDTIAGGGLTRSGSGTTASPYKVGIKPNGIVNSMIADRAVSLRKISSSATDSGRFLFADGSGVRPLHFYASHHQDTSALRAITPRTVTWQLVADTGLTLAFGSNSYNTVSAPGLKDGDMCFTNGGHLVAAWASVGLLTYLSLHGTSSSFWVRLRCYRPL
ncbi:hypothetical protein FACS189446_0760 [Bacteroidia bacterium]|nr:hypothetical protein FACS189446_0760 [Bacteroidia bacterium]